MANGKFMIQMTRDTTTMITQRSKETMYEKLSSDGLVHLSEHDPMTSVSLCHPLIILWINDP